MTGQTLWANPTPQIITIIPNSASLTASSTALTFTASSPLTITTTTPIMGTLVTASMFTPSSDVN